MSKERLALLIRRMDAVAAIYRLAASLSPGIDALRSHVDTLILTPIVWEERLMARFCVQLNLHDCFVAVETRDALERRDLRLWCHPTWVFGRSYRTLETVSSHGSPGGRLRTESPSRKRASIPHPERMAQAAPAFGISPSEKRTLDLVTDHPMVPRGHLAVWLGVSEGRVSQMMHSLVDTWGLVERRGRHGDTRYTLSAEGIRYVTHRDRAQLPTTQGIWSTALTTDRQGRRRHVGHRIDTWARQPLPGHRVGSHEVRGRREAEQLRCLSDAVGRQVVSLAGRQVGGAVTHPPGDAFGQEAGQGAVDRGVRLAENERQFRRIYERRPAEQVEQLSVGDGHVSSLPEQWPMDWTISVR